MIKWSIYDSDWRPLCPAPLQTATGNAVTEQSDADTELVEYQRVQERIRVSKKRMIEYFNSEYGIYRHLLSIDIRYIAAAYVECYSHDDITRIEYEFYRRLFDEPPSLNLSWTRDVTMTLSQVFRFSDIEENKWLDVLSIPIVFYEVAKRLDCRSVRRLACVCRLLQQTYGKTRNAIMRTFSPEYKHYRWMCKSVSGQKTEQELRFEEIRRKYGGQ